MSKAVLVMDMPESCSKCPFMYEFNGFKKCHLLNCLRITNSTLSVDEFTKKRVGKCPFVELPEPKDQTLQTCTAQEALIYRENKGFNDCLDAITGN